MSRDSITFRGLSIALLAGLGLLSLAAGSAWAEDDEAAVLERIRPVAKVKVTGAAPVEAAAPKAARSGKEVVDAACAACHATGAAGSPKLGDKAAWDARVAQGFEKALSHAINGFNAMPPRGGNPSISDEEMHNAVAHMFGLVGASAPATSTATEMAGPTPAAVDTISQGEQVYKGVCFACHDTGAAGAPKLGDKAAWGPRIAQGAATLEDHALNGFRGMPPKGGNMGLTNEDIAHVVEYMVSKAR